MSRAARHIALPQVGRDGQARIEASSALIVGLGGLGSAAASYLACAGVGHLLLNDFDTVDETNLGRQILYGPADVGVAKAERAAARLAAMNPDVRLTVLGDRLSADDLQDAVGKAAVVLDGCDNFATRFLINEAVVRSGKTLVSGAAIRFEGQIGVFGPDYSASPCYRCLYREADESLDSCAGNGVLSAVPGVIGAMMAVEGLKLMAGIETPRGVLGVYDALAAEWRRVRIPKRPNCPVCANG